MVKNYFLTPASITTIFIIIFLFNYKYCCHTLSEMQECTSTPPSHAILSTFMPNERLGLCWLNGGQEGQERRGEKFMAVPCIANASNYFS